MSTQPFVLDYRFDRGSSAENIPLELTSNKPYLQVRVNGSGPYWFILDTGSITNVVDSDLAASLGIQPGGTVESSGAGDSTISGFTGDRLNLGLDGLDLTIGPFDILPINKAISLIEGRRVYGLLGYGFFANFVVTIDYLNRRLCVYDPRTYVYSGNGTTVRIELVRGNALIAATLTAGGKRFPGAFLVDTAWRSALSLNAPFVAGNGLLDTTRTIEAVTGIGVGGPTIDAVGRVEALETGPIAIQSPIANFSRARSGILAQSDMTGIIGGEVLRRFTVVFNYPRKEMILEPNAHFVEPYEFDMSGLTVTAEGENLETLRVYYVVGNSPADEAGLRAGDVITAIDGQPAAGITVERTRQLFKQGAGKEIDLRVLRGEQPLDVKLRLRRLI